MVGVLSVQKFSSRLLGSFVLSSAKRTLARPSASACRAETFFTYSKEPSQPVDNVPKYVSAEEAVKCIKSGDTVFVSGAASTPINLVNAMTDHGKANKLSKVTVCHMHTEGKAPYTDPECEGFAPDQHGYCSLGTSVDCVRAGLSYSKKVIAQINPHMPRTFGDAQVHISHFDYAVNVDTPLPEHGGKPPSPEEVQIGKLIAENLVEDGATLQMGIGNIPDSVLIQLGNHKDLGVHSEMFSGGLVDLVAKGAVTNNNKTHNKGKIIGSFLIGTKKLYDFVDNNPFIEMKEVHYVNGLHQIARNPKMTAINSCMEIDLTGQVVSDSIGTRMYSGFGGQVDFIRGAGEGYDGKGKPIIAMASMSPRGVSKIVPCIKEGAGVVTTRAHVQYVVTEQGIADLFGKSLRQRAYELIKIAHPSVRESLEKAAFERLKVMPSP